MTVRKDVLIDRGEVLLRRLQREYRRLRKVHHIKDEEEVDVIANLNVSRHLLEKRVADEIRLVATCPPQSVMCKEEKADAKSRNKDVLDMFLIITKARELTRNMLQDIADEYKIGADSRSEEKQSYIEDARKVLDEMKLDFPLDADLLESIECEAKIIDQN